MSQKNIFDYIEEDNLEKVPAPINDKGEYELDNNWISFNNNKLFKGNIYIPINTNPLNAANADGNEVKESTAYRYEQRQQVWDKQQKQKATNTATLWQ